MTDRERVTRQFDGRIVENMLDDLVGIAAAAEQPAPVDLDLADDADAAGRSRVDVDRAAAGRHLEVQGIGNAELLLKGVMRVGCRHGRQPQGG